eukprot:gene11881-13781_t
MQHQERTKKCVRGLAVTPQCNIKRNASEPRQLRPFDAPIFRRHAIFKVNRGYHSLTVPDGVSSLNVTLNGAEGGYIYEDFLRGGQGGVISAIVPVKPGEVYYVFVGGPGDESSGGYNGGGAPYPLDAGFTGGGGATDLRSSMRLEDRLLVAGGGGGTAAMCESSGGSAGFPFGEDGSGNCSFAVAGGQGGTQTSGGLAYSLFEQCTNSSGSLGQGGSGCTEGGAGGGGGYYGGAGSYGAGAGGGSSYSAYPIDHTEQDYQLDNPFGWQYGSARLWYERILPSGSVVFESDPSTLWQGYVVPAGVTLLHVELHGAEGNCNTAGSGGMGGMMAANLSVTPGEELRIYVGDTTTSMYGARRNGGGRPSGNNYFGGGGGATDIRRAPYKLNDQLLVAGGGGGCHAPCLANGGHGGFPTGTPGSTGTLCSEGMEGAVAVRGGPIGVGEDGIGDSGAGGGGGWYGGYGGYKAGGGGGSSYSSVAKFSYINGENTGAGYAIVRPIVDTASTASTDSLSASPLASHSSCYLPEACKEDGTCSALYTGENCAECASGMLRINQKCVSCDAAYAGIVLLAVFVLVYGVYIYKSKMCTEVLLRCYLGVDIVQLLSLLSTVTLTSETPSFVPMTLNALTSLYVNLFLLVSTCLGSPHTDPAAQFQSIFIAVNVLPVAAAVFLYVICALNRWSVHTYLVVLGAVLSLLYCLLLATSLAVFDCTTTMSDDGYSYLAAIGPIEQGRCGVEDDVQFKLVPWAVLCGIVYGLGIPVYLYEVYKYYLNSTGATEASVLHSPLFLHSSATGTDTVTVRALLWLLCTVVRKGMILLVLYLTDSPNNSDGGRTIGLVVVMVVLYVSYVAVGTSHLASDPAKPSIRDTNWLAPQPKQRVLMVCSGGVTLFVLVLSLTDNHDACLVVAVLLMMLLGVTVLCALCVSTTTLHAHTSESETTNLPKLPALSSEHVERTPTADLEAGYATSTSPINIENPMKLRLNSMFSSTSELGPTEGAASNHASAADDNGRSDGSDGDDLDDFQLSDIEPGGIDNPSQWLASIHSGDNNGSDSSDWLGMFRMEDTNSSISSDADLFSPQTSQHTIRSSGTIERPESTLTPAFESTSARAPADYSAYNAHLSARLSMRNPLQDSAGMRAVGVASGDNMVYITETIENVSEGTVLDTRDDEDNYSICDSEGVYGADAAAADAQNEEVSTALPNMNMRYLTLRHMDTPHRPVHALPSPTAPVQYVEYMHARDGKRGW